MLLLCKAVKEEMIGLKATLRRFELALGLRINLGKNSVIGIGLAGEDHKPLAEEVGCGVGKLPLLYLDLQVGAKPK